MITIIANIVSNKTIQSLKKYSNPTPYNGTEQNTLCYFLHAHMENAAQHIHSPRDPNTQKCPRNI